MKLIGRIAAALVLTAVTAGTAACGSAPSTPSTPPQAGEQPGAVHPAPPTVNPTVAATCKSAWAGGQQVWFTDRGGVAIGGVMLGTGTKGGVVLAHTAGADACQWLPFGRQLAAAGYRVLAFDFAGSGVSGPLTDGRDDNVLAAAAYLHGHGVLTVVLVGASMGGNAALVAAPKVIPPVAGVITLSAPVTYQGLDAAPAAKELAAPVLYIAAKGDGEFAGDAQALYASTPGNAKTLLIATGSQHGTDLLDKAKEPDAAKVRQAILDFLKAHAPVTG